MQQDTGATYTFLFTAIEGAARYWEMQPRLMQPTLDRHYAILQQAVAAGGGTIFQVIGDQCCIAFPDSAAALAAAAAVQRALLAEDWGGVGSLRVKMALHCGPAEQRGEDYYAPLTLNRLSRMLAVCAGGQMLVSAALNHALAGRLATGLSLLDLGERLLRDLPAERLYRLAAPDLLDTFPPLPTLDPRPHNLPAQLTSFVGREVEVAAIRACLRQHNARLLTIVGPGGVGKTRLSLQVAAGLVDEYAGVYFVPLASSSNRADLLGSLAATLGLNEQAGGSLEEILRGFVQSRRLLLVLDNFEQLLEAAPLLGDLLTAAPTLSLLVSSREPLHLAGEQEYPLSPLPLPDLKQLPALAELQRGPAVALFVSRAGAVNPHFRLSEENAAAVAAICVRLDGLPLAIELAAARCKLITAPQLEQRLGSRLALVSQLRVSDPRQRSLRETIAWSYDLLSPAEQQLYRRLALFSAGCTVAAASAVSPNAGDDLAATLDALADKSLLRRLIPPAGVETAADLRYTMLQTILEFAAEKLAASGEAVACAERHAAYYLWLAETAEPELRSSRQGYWLNTLEAEHSDLRQAITWGLSNDPPLALRLAGALWRFWEGHGHLSLGRELLAATLAATPDGDPAARANALNGAGNLAFWQGDHPAATSCYEQALLLRRQLGDRRGEAASLNNLGNVAGEARDYPTATARYQTSLAIARELGDQRLIGTGLYNLGNIALAAKDYAVATPLLEESRAISQQRGDKQATADVALSLAGIALWHGNYQQARALYMENLAIAHELNDKIATAIALDGLGRVAYAEGELIEAERFYQAAFTLSHDCGYQLLEATALLRLGNLKRVQDSKLEAQRLLTQGLRLAASIDDLATIVDALTSFGLLAAEDDTADSRRAVQLLISGEALFEQNAWLPLERAHYDRTITRCREQLGEAAFGLAWAAGQAMSRAQAVAYALAAT